MYPKKSKTKNKGSLGKQIFREFSGNPNKAFNYKKIAAKLKIYDPNKRALIQQTLLELKGKEKIIEINKGKYKLKQTHSRITGIVDMKASGNAYIVSSDAKDDIFIHTNNTNTALDGDTVEVLIHTKNRRRGPEGEILNVIERKRTTFAGTLQLSSEFAFLIPDKKNMNTDIYIPKVDSKVKDGIKAIARITEWPKGAKKPVGEIIEILGESGNNDVEMKSILVESGLSIGFPEEVMQETAGLNVEISKEEISSRRDFRKITTFTIDPDDANDFDDALSVRKLQNDNWEIGIHIADVSHYVRPGTVLDKEAYDRGTSVYLVDRVIPMLPEKISNELCSLRPEEEKLCFSAVFEIDNNAHILKKWFGRTVIYSDKRFTYDNAQKVIQDKKGEFFEELSILNELSRKLKKKRFEEGAISFETIEVKFRLDPQGVPLGVYLKERKEAHFLVEEFMLLANKKVAEFVSKSKDKAKLHPFVYRVHDHPDPEKLSSFRNFAKIFGYKITFDTPRQISANLNKLLEKVKGKPEQNIMEQMAIRTMSKASYTTKNIGHYGLGFNHYTHFTSPIRRYPDVLVHRLLNQILSNTKTQQPQDLEDKCIHVSAMETNAMEAERNSKKYKQAEYLQKQTGKIFDGIIVGIIQSGFFVEIIENKCEGFVRMNRLTDDYYIHDEKNFCIKGKSTGRKYHFGDRVKVMVAEIDLAKRTIDLELVENN